MSTGLSEELSTHFARPYANARSLEGGFEYTTLRNEAAYSKQ